MSLNIGVTDAFSRGLKEMERQGADRVVLAIYESEPSQTGRGIWLNEDAGPFAYYPFEVLTPGEQAMIIDGKTYTVVSLARRDVGGLISYAGDGIERYHRTRVNHFLPRLEAKSNLNYITEGGTYADGHLRDFAEVAAKSGWTPEMIDMSVEAGIQEYREKTQELMEKAGVYDTLEKMGERENTPFEQVMADMNNSIRKSKSNR